MVALGLALGASIAWGGSDFLAGLVTRRLPVLTVLILGNAAGLLLLLMLLVAAGDPVPPYGATLAAAAAGVAEMLGFVAFYRRSEERRVGKECRSRWWPYDGKKTQREQSCCCRAVGEL